jgi:SOS-response transcriptional repressor LexA
MPDWRRCSWKPEAIWAAPSEWCLNPASTISLRVVGNSMSALILEGYIIALNTSDIPRDDLVGQIVVARNTEEKRLLVSRLIRFDHPEALVPDQREHQSVSLANGTSWRIIGRILGGQEKITAHVQGNSVNEPMRNKTSEKGR